ncbi:hypothetical protein [Ruminococcus sp. FC2018]|uniref:hypothetical protein n=1 Tax=Ruminococcus sp. FC2018 TaxID=1410617 RepID=UPI0004903774|nr:hypothetical protein [Ruminococcus sp. FC2018]
MFIKKIVSIAAALALACSMFCGCENKDSSDSSGDSSGSSVQSQSQAESKSDASSQGSSQAGADSSSQEQNKTNAIGYDVKGSKRLYDSLKETYNNKDGYKVTMVHANTGGSTIVLNKKDNKIFSSTANNNSKTAILYTGDKKATMFDFTNMKYQEQAVTDEKSFVAQKDLLFGMTGDFVQAQIDQKSDVIVETYKVNKNVAGQDGQIGFCFKGSDGSFCEVYLLYEGAQMAEYFGVREIGKASDELFKMPEIKDYKKV